MESQNDPRDCVRCSDCRRVFANLYELDLHKCSNWPLPMFSSDSIEVKSFVENVNALLAKHYSAPFGRIVELQEGPKYIRVVARDVFEGEVRSDTGSAYCFIDRSNGNILKPAGWKTPEKKNPRSNITDETNGMKGVTPYGTTYLR